MTLSVSDLDSCRISIYLRLMASSLHCDMWLRGQRELLQLTTCLLVSLMFGCYNSKRRKCSQHVNNKATSILLQTSYYSKRPKDKRMEPAGCGYSCLLLNYQSVIVLSCRTNATISGLSFGHAPLKGTLHFLGLVLHPSNRTNSINKYHRVTSLKKPLTRGPKLLLHFRVCI